MKEKLVSFVVILAIFAFAPIVMHGAHHGHGGKHIILKPDDLQWKDGPPSLPPGAQFIVIEGDPSQEGIFTMRLKVPADYRIPPHTHPKVERVTVIEGEFQLGTGRKFDEQRLETLPTGSFFVMPPGMEHFVLIGEETIVQLTGMGPWEIHYIDPADDPRRVTE